MTMGGEWNPAADIERRLDALSAIYPSSVLLAVDAEGLDFLTNALKDSQGVAHLTDNGGGDLTPAHLDTVIGHIGFAKIIVWMTDPTDADLVRAACRKVEQMVSDLPPITAG